MRHRSSQKICPLFSQQPQCYNHERQSELLQSSFCCGTQACGDSTPGSLFCSGPWACFPVSVSQRREPRRQPRSGARRSSCLGRVSANQPKPTILHFVCASEFCRWGLAGGGRDRTCFALGPRPHSPNSQRKAHERPRSDECTRREGSSSSSLPGKGQPLLDPWQISETRAGGAGRRGGSTRRVCARGGAQQTTPTCLQPGVGLLSPLSQPNFEIADVTQPLKNRRWPVTSSNS